MEHIGIRNEMYPRRYCHLPQNIGVSIFSNLPRIDYHVPRCLESRKHI